MCRFGSNLEVSTDLDPILKAFLYLILMSINGSIFAVSAKLGPILSTVLGLILQCQQNWIPFTQPGYNFLKGNFVIDYIPWIKAQKFAYFLGVKLEVCHGA